jgi:hypothetical protein
MVTLTIVFGIHITKKTTLPICSPMAPLHYAHRNHIPFLSTSHNLYWNKYKLKAREGRWQNHSKEKVLTKKGIFLIIIINQLDNLLKLVSWFRLWILEFLLLFYFWPLKTNVMGEKGNTNPERITSWKQEKWWQEKWKHIVRERQDKVLFCVHAMNYSLANLSGLC